MLRDEKILVTGGAGYIGSHVVQTLQQSAYDVAVLDNLSTGFADSVGSARFYCGDIRDKKFVLEVIKKEKITCVFHFAAATVISDSIANPLFYYENNVGGTLALLQASIQAGVSRFIFSSTAAVYGVQNATLIDEHSPLAPQNPYGQSKLMAERLLRDAAHAHSLDYVILRYFNVAGASPCGTLGQRTKQATHLIKTACETACQRRAYLPIYGEDYDTKDGTCVRDFIHVSDLAQAHLLALNYLQKGGKSEIFNCGYGQGYSVKQVVQAIERIQQKPLPVKSYPRRTGDLPMVVSNNRKIREKLHFSPQYNQLETMIKTALEFEKIVEGSL